MSPAGSFSHLSILFVGISALIAVLTPIVLLLILRIRFKGPLLPALGGVAAFVVFALILEQLVHYFTLIANKDTSIFLLIMLISTCSTAA